MKEEVIKLLKKSDQELVFLDAKITPVRSLVGQSKKDRKMHQIALELMADKIITQYTGFFSLSEGGHVYITAFFLSTDFFKMHCKKRQLSVQLSLFK